MLFRSNDCQGGLYTDGGHEHVADYLLYALYLTEPVSYTHLDVYKRQVLSTVEAGGIRGVAVKCLDITKNSDCEGRTGFLLSEKRENSTRPFTVRKGD